MSIVQRFFSTTGAGAADGTSWANRAALFSAGNWSTVITGFAFNGADSLQCFIGPGTYTCSQALASGLFSNAPSAANPIVLCGCDSSGVLLTIPDPTWLSCQPRFDNSTFPNISTASNVTTINLANCFLYLLTFSSTGATTNQILGTCAGADWITVTHSSSSTSAAGVGTGTIKLTNSWVLMTAANYRACVTWSSAPQNLDNVRCEGNAGSSGNRYGVEFIGSASIYGLNRCTCVNNGGAGVGTSSATTTHAYQVKRSVIANNGAGIVLNTTASQTGVHDIDGCMITGNSGWGIDGASAAAKAFVSGNRLRDNSSGNITGLGNYPTDLNNYTTDSDDATEYVSTGANGDFRIKNTATSIWGKGYGVADQPAGGGLLRPVAMNGGLV